ncbi:HD domain-containing phosphohydrolase [Thermobrachium celere]|uniref:Uncharacterized protein n=1 Tax=Thermobrachium celere DSM 8682 TaxID=941824 RepID=R7RUG6_9CLOT|nr:HD domain-containing phosphohydrolase [Thermobrachium celere]CDF59141.1 hypothetical protein TCEL_02209 [Thermobrachium celere DSM 8682]
MFLVFVLVFLQLYFTDNLSKRFLNEVEKQRRLELKQKVEIAYNAIEPILEQKRQGKITEEEARREVANVVRRMIYKDEYSYNYIFMSTYNGIYLVQPFQPEKEGTNQWNYKDPTGKYVIQELTRAAKSSKDGAYVKYQAFLPNSNEYEEKLSYVKGIPEINAYIGTGVYVNSAFKNMNIILKQQRILFTLTSLMGMLLFIVYLIKLSKLNKMLKREVERRKETEERLVEEKERETKQREYLQALFCNSQDGIAEFDREGYVVNVNDAFLKMFSYTREECIGKDIDTLVVPKERYKEARECTDIAIREGMVNIETVRYGKYNNPINVLLRSVSIRINGKVVGGYAIYTDITEIKDYEKQLRYLSLHDSLTGFYNLNYYNKVVDAFEGKKGSVVSVILADVNGLKLINDTMGHQYGDKLLKMFAVVVKRCIKNGEICARIGGDEFVIIMPNYNEEDAENLVKKIKSEIEKFNETLDEKILTLSVAMGYSTAKRNKTIKDAIKEADDMMYKDKLLNKASSKNQIMNVLMATLAEKDFITHGHTERVRKICEKIADRMNLSDAKKNNLLLLADVHDLGKVAIPDDILNKKGKLTDEEWEIMKAHTEKGYRIALNSNELSSIADLILKHHERWDGKGYPLGLKGDEIPIECRILAVADSYDAMTNSRGYNKVKTHEEAIEEIKRCSGTQFDPDVVEAFLNIIQK